MPRAPLVTLPAGVHAVRCGEDAVLLDERADAYLCLPSRGALVVGPGAVRLDVASRRRLADAGLVPREGDAAPPPRGGRSPPPRPDRSAVPDAPPSPRPGDLRDGLWLLAETFRFYRGRSFAQVLDRARTARAGRSASPADDALLAAAARFHGWLPYAPAPAKCLLRSFMLLRLLQSKGFQADWVFGVRTWPFAAHCWLQAGRVVLDDVPERLDVYEPILVV